MINAKDEPVSVGIKSDLGKALIAKNGYSLVKINPL